MKITKEEILKYIELTAERDLILARYRGELENFDPEILDPCATTEGYQLNKLSDRLGTILVELNNLTKTK